MMTRPMVAMRPRKMSGGLTTAGALAVAAFVACISPTATTRVAQSLGRPSPFVRVSLDSLRSDAFAH